MKKKLLSMFFAVALVMGMVPAAAFADPLTDVVIHKRVVATGTQPAEHDGKEMANPPGTAIEGVVFKYWTVTDLADVDALKTLSTAAAVDAYIAANPGELSGGTTTGATNATGVLNLTLDKGKYFFAEVNGGDLNIDGYVGVPFFLELPAMKTDGTGYFGTGTEALHIYPKNVQTNPGLDIETIDESGNRIPTGTDYGADFELQKSDGTSYVKDRDLNFPQGFVTLSNLPNGEYQLVNTKAPEGYLLDNRPVKFTVKNSVVTFDSPNSPMAEFFAAGVLDDNARIQITFVKKPVVTKTDKNDGSQEIGKIVTWEITTTIPTNIEDYLSFALVDVLDTRLDYAGNVSVTSTGGTITAGTHYTLTEPTLPAVTGGGTLRVAFAPAQLLAHAGETITVTFDTKINAGAISGTPIPNQVDLDYNNGHGDTGTIKPPVTEVWTGGYQWKKVAGAAGGDPLAGAEFKIARTSAPSDYVVWTAELITVNQAKGYTFAKTPVVGEEIVMKSDGSGLFGIEGLKGGKYWLVETVAPKDAQGNQYNLLTDPVEFEITQTSHGTVIDVVNKTGFQIPQTGGIGTLLFTVIGVALMGLAIALFRRKKAPLPSEE